MFQSDGCALPAFKFWSELDHQHQRRLPTRSTTRTMVVSRSSPQHVSRSRSCPQSSNLKRSSCCVLASHRVALRASSLSSTVPVLTTRRKHSMANSEDFWSTCRLSRHRFSSRVTSTHGSTGRTTYLLYVSTTCCRRTVPHSTSISRRTLWAASSTSSSLATTADQRASTSTTQVCPITV